MRARRVPVPQTAVRLATRLILALVLVAAGAHGAAGATVARPAEWAQPVPGTRLGNLHKVSDDVYRSAQPDHTDMITLERLGVRSVLNLRDFHSDRAALAGTNLQLLVVPMSASSVGREHLVAITKAITAAPKPVLVHCWHGSDRTGLAIATYRIVFQGWPKEKALDEMRHGGFGFHERWYPGIVRLIEATDFAAVKQEALGPRPSPTR